MQKTITLGLMSGTSLDGVDAVAVDFAGSVPQFRGHYHVPFTDEMRAELLALCTPGNNEIDRMGRTSVELAKIYAHAIAELLNTADIPRKEVAAAGVHGQTIRHRPEEGWTLQLNNPAMVAELSGLNVIADFRTRDVAAGGEGAPLVPAFHAQVFTGNVARSIVNIGGISNITFLPPVKSYGSVTGFDCGPGNILLDAWCAKHLERPYDAGGRWAATGTVNEALLTRLMAEPYFTKEPPKSTGRELFNLAWLENILKEFPSVSAADVQATLTRFTAKSIVDAVTRFAGRTEELYVCGGGALNRTLMASLQDEAGAKIAKAILTVFDLHLCDTLLQADPDSSPIAKIAVKSTMELGVAPMHVEAMAFAWLAWAFLKRQAGNLPEVTAATGPRILGALYPH